MWTINISSHVVMGNDELTRKCEKLLNNKSIQATSIRIEILKPFVLKQDQHFTIKEICKHLLIRKKPASISTVAEMLATFKGHGILSLVVDNAIQNQYHRKRGRPSIKYCLSQEIIKRYKSHGKPLFCL